MILHTWIINGVVRAFWTETPEINGEMVELSCGATPGSLLIMTTHFLTLIWKDFVMLITHNSSSGATPRRLPSLPPPFGNVFFVVSEDVRNRTGVWMWRAFSRGAIFSNNMLNPILLGSSNASWYISWRVSRPRKVTGLIYHLAVVSYPSPFQKSDSEVMPSFSLPFQIPTRVPMHSVNRAYRHCVFRFPPNRIPGFRLPTLFFISLSFTWRTILLCWHATQKAFRTFSLPFP